MVPRNDSRRETRVLSRCENSFAPIQAALDGWQQVDATASLGLGALLHSNPVTAQIANSPLLGWKYGRDDWWNRQGFGNTPAYSDAAIAEAQQVISEHVAQLGAQLVGAPTQDLGGSLAERLTAIHKKNLDSPSSFKR